MKDYSTEYPWPATFYTVVIGHRKSENKYTWGKVKVYCAGLKQKSKRIYPASNPKSWQPFMQLVTFLFLATLMMSHAW